MIETMDWSLISRKSGDIISLSTKKTILIGCDSCDIILRYKSVDSRHAAIKFHEDGFFYVKDLNSTFGTFINNEKITPCKFIKLNYEDTIRFGFSFDSFKVHQMKKVKITRKNFKNDGNNNFCNGRRSPAQQFSPQSTDRDSGVCGDDYEDEKSDNGTYTIDKEDPDVNAARKRIDEVFGVGKFDDEDNNSSPCINNCSPDLGNLANSFSAVYKLYKKRANANKMDDFFEKSNHYQRSCSPVVKPPRMNSVTSRRLTQSKSVSTSRESNLNTSLFDDSKSMCSDNGSIGSDKSVNFGRSRNDVGGGSLRFNRAFALRRARLGMDTLGTPVSLKSEERHANKINNQVKTNDRFQRQLTNVTRSSSTSRNASLTRNDGGRYSFRK